MKKSIFLLFLAMMLFITCSDDVPNEMNGFWQLQEITYPDGSVSKNDSIFYAFQKEVLFSFNSVNPTDVASVSFGFIQYPDPSRIAILMDTAGLSAGVMSNVKKDFLDRSGWKGYCDTFNIQLNGNKLRLTDSNNKIYSFRKY